MTQITIDRAVVEQALEALEWHYRQGHSNTLGGLRLKIDEKALRNLKAALAQQAEPVQEPVAYIHRKGNYWEVSERFLLDGEKARGWTEEPLYRAPPQRKPLTEEEVEQCFRAAGITIKGHRWTNAVRNVERAHGIGEQP